MKSLSQTANTYVEFAVADKTTGLPYYIHLPDRPTLTTTHGKGSVEEIRAELLEIAQQKNVDLNAPEKHEILNLMRLWGIGIDCSGFVYHVLDPFVREQTGKPLSAYLLRHSGLRGHLEKVLKSSRRVRKISAANLTSDLNTIKVHAAKNVQPGDFLRLTHEDYEGKHVAVFVDVSPTILTYAHSSESTEMNGPHFAQIKIEDVTLGLEKQEWLEQAKDGRNYGKYAFHPKRGDSVRRLKCLK